MTADPWNVTLVGQAKRFTKNLSAAAQKAFLLLLKELVVGGPVRHNLPNFGKLQGIKDSYHCHLQKGRPTYVCCWKTISKKEKQLEVYYAGTHENAPY